MALNKFNGVAAVYDRLAAIVFGKAMVKAQTFYLSSIKPGASVLILGGGTGWILSELCMAVAVNDVCYIEASSEMIAKAKNRNVSSCSIRFIHGTEDDIPEGVIFDAVITNFYFDLFSAHQLEIVIDKILRATSNKTVWLATDFVTDGKLWQTVLLRIMYFFFMITCGLQTKVLPRWQMMMQRKGIHSQQSKTFYNRFITSELYRL